MFLVKNRKIKIFPKSKKIVNKRFKILQIVKLLKEEKC